MEHLRGIVTYIAFQQSNELLQHCLGLSEQALVDTESLESRVPGSTPIDLCIAERSCSLGQVVCITANVAALCLGYLGVR